MSELSGLTLYSALSEQVYRRSYRRDAADQPLIIPGDGGSDNLTADISISGWSLVVPTVLNIQNDGQSSLPSQFTISGNYIYDIATGFVAMVATDGNGNYVVTFRGTDAGDFKSSTLIAGALNYLTGGGTAPPPANEIDDNDLTQNFLMGSGLALNQSQAQDAIDLTKAVIALAGNANNVTVTGQSLGGGLAGIVSSVLGVKGYGFDSAPFYKQAFTSAAVEAVEDAVANDTILQAFLNGNSTETGSLVAQICSLITKNYVYSSSLSGAAPVLLNPPYFNDSNFQTALSIILHNAGVDVWIGLNETGDVSQQGLQNALALFTTSLSNEMLAAYQPYASNIASVATNFTQWQIAGQALDQTDAQGWAAFGLNLAGAQAFPGGQNSIALATYNMSNIDWSLHSPSLIALALETQATGYDFSTVTTGDAALQDALFNNQGIAGPEDNARQDPQYFDDVIVGGVTANNVPDSSYMPQYGPDMGVLYRALWKSFSQTSGSTSGLYGYFYNLYNNLLDTNAAAVGLSDDQLNVGTVHTGIVRLTLQVLRDALANTTTLDDVITNLAAEGISNWNFAGIDDDNLSDPTQVVVNLHDIKPQTGANSGQEVDSTTEVGAAWGVGDLDTVLWNALSTALGGDTNVTKLTGLTKVQVFGTPAATVPATLDIPAIQIPAVNGQGFGWKIAVVQVGTGEMDYVPDTLSVTHADGTTSQDSDTGTLIIGGDGDDDITGSTAQDFILLGNGNNTVNATWGDDIVVAGTGKTTIDVDGTAFEEGPSSTNNDTSYVLADPTGGTTTVNIGAELTGQFKVYTNQKSPIGQGGDWTEYVGTDSGETYTLWVQGSATQTLTDASLNLLLPTSASRPLAERLRAMR
jgi:hypothetical protein